MLSHPLGVSNGALAVAAAARLLSLIGEANLSCFSREQFIFAHSRSVLLKSQLQHFCYTEEEIENQDLKWSSSEATKEQFFIRWATDSRTRNRLIWSTKESLIITGSGELFRHETGVETGNMTWAVVTSRLAPMSRDMATECAMVIAWTNQD